MIDPLILETLCCPATRQRLEIADANRVALLNRNIQAQTVRNRAGELVTETVESGLVSADGAWLYPVDQQIPRLLAEAAIFIGRTGAPPSLSAIP